MIPIASELAPSLFLSGPELGITWRGPVTSSPATTIFSWPDSAPMGMLPTRRPRTKGQWGKRCLCSVMGSSPSTQSPTQLLQKAHLVSLSVTGFIRKYSDLYLQLSWLLRKKKPALARSAGCMKGTVQLVKEASLAASLL